MDKKYDIIDLEKLYGEIKSCIVGGVYSWYNKYEELIRFFDENKMRPNKESKNNDEKTLGIWLGTQKKNYKNKIHSMKDTAKIKLWEELIERYIELMMDIDEKWMDNYNKVINYFNENKKKPNEKSKDEDEKKLGLWIKKQKGNFKNKTNSMKNEANVELWKKLNIEYKIYLMSNDDLWIDNYYRVLKFFTEEKRRPSVVAKNNDEKILGAWICTQKKNYKKKVESLKEENEDKIKLWEKLVDEYNL